MRVMSSDRHTQRKLLGRGLTPAASRTLCQEQNVCSLLGMPCAAAAPVLRSRLCSQVLVPWPAEGQSSLLLLYPKILHQNPYREASPSSATKQSEQASTPRVSTVLLPSPGRQAVAIVWRKPCVEVSPVLLHPADTAASAWLCQPGGMGNHSNVSSP